MKDLVIIGAKGCAKEVIFLLEENNKLEREWNILGFIDEANNETSDLNYPILGNDKWLINYKETINVVCAIGNPEVRRNVIGKYKKYQHIVFPTILSRHALIGDRNIIGHGAIICSGATITVGVHVGDFSIINIGSTVCHESTVGNFVTIAPGVNVSGNVKIGKDTSLGVGVKVIQNICIGSNVTVGAGAVIINDIPDNCTAVGVPAKVLVKEENKG